MVKKIFFWVAVVALISWAGLASYGTWTFYNQLNQAQTTNQELLQKQETVEKKLATTTEKLEKQIKTLEDTVKTQEKIIESREKFLASLPPAQAAIVSAADKVDITALKQKILDAQEVVASEKKDFTVVDTQTELVNGVTAEITAAVQAYDAEIARQQEEENSRNNYQNNNGGGGSGYSGGSNNGGGSGGSGGSSGGSGGGGGSTGGSTQNYPGLDIVRQALNDVGGSWVSLGAADIVCRVDWAAACAHPGGYIEVDTQYLGNSYWWWYPIMMHEYAHQIQYNHWTKLNNSNRYYELFGGDAEWLADCMSAARISGYESAYGYSCSQDQINYGSGGWSGNF